MAKFTPMQDYLYLRLSQKEPWDLLYFTPALTGIHNLDDQSFSISPELVYTGPDQPGTETERDLLIRRTRE